MTTMLERVDQGVGARPNHALRLLPLAALITDFTMVSVTALLAVLGRRHLDFFPNPYDAQEALGVAGPLIVSGWIAIIAAFGGYDRAVFGSGTDEYKRVVRATFVTAAAVGIGCYLVKFQLSRGFFLIAFGVGLPLLVLGRFLLRRALHRARRRGHLHARVLMAGTPRQIDEVAQVLQGKPWLGYSIVGAVVPSAQTLLEETAAGVPVVGASEELVQIADAVEADVIFFAGGGIETGDDLKQTAWQLEEHGINVVIAPSVTDVSSERITVRPIGGLPLIHIEHPTWADASRWGKRTFDILGSAALILAFSPLLVFVAARIWVADRGAVLFQHHRVGRNGENFECLKFRTMVPNAEAMVEQLQQQTGQSALLFKMKDDPRITKPGRWLRRFSVDELPQLFNVLRGDMSLVGPRPQVQKEVDLYEGGMERRLLVRPGMTGLWQVSGRNDLAPEEARRLDLYYVDNWSMIQDVSILVRTFGAVFGSRGAY
ncbi:sugar transferase [Nocardioides sp. BGMRC 2183]|nr:sugar transferase [Nocardioides sp. BGMRC 2183]